MAYDLVARLKLIDNMSGPLRRATGGIRGIGGVALGAAGSLAKLTGVITGVGAAVGAVALIGNSLDKAMKFEQQIDAIASLDNSLKKGSKGYADMQALALKLGSTTKYSALEAAQGMEELVKAGMPMETMLNGGAEAALNLAAAGGVEVAKAAEVMAVAMNSFKKDGLTAAQAADILAGTANAAATGVDDLKYGIAAAGAVASGLGATFRDTATAIGLFTNNGLGASDAGTSLKSMFGNLQPTTAKQIAMFEELGLMTKDGSNAFFDLNGNIKDMGSVAGLLRSKLKGLTNQQRSAALELMFGSDAVRAATILYEEGADGVKKFQDQMANSTALKMARDRMDNAAGAVEQFKGAIETLQISALLPTLPLIKDLADAASSFLTQYGPKITESVRKAVDSAKSYIKTSYLDNPEFMNLPDLSSQIVFIWEDILKSFNTWMDKTGRDKIQEIATNISDFLGSVLKASTPLIEAAVNIGTAIAQGVITGFWDAIKTDPKLAALMGGAAGGKIAGPWGAVIGAGSAGGAAIVEKYRIPEGAKKEDLPAWQKPFYKEPRKKWADMKWYEKASPNNWNWLYPQPTSHASGLNRVPYNGYPARLHKDEMVLTPEASDEYRKGGGGHTFSFGDININGASGNVDEMADQLMRVIARRVSEAGGQM